MTTTIRIPDTMEGLLEGLGGLERLLTAKRWERAAIVYAWTKPAENQHEAERNTVQQMSIRAFARLGIVGLKNPEEVREYRRAWESAAAEIGNDDMLDIRPGETVELPDLPWKDHFGEPTAVVQAHVAKAYIAKNPEVVREAIMAIPAVTQVVVDTVVGSDALSRRVEDRIFLKRHGVRQDVVLSDVMRPEPRNRDKEMANAIFTVNALLRDERDGAWTPDGISESLLRLLGISLADRHAKDVPDIFDQIDAHLTSSKEDEQEER